MHSTDAGVSWRRMDQAPLLLMVAFGDGDARAGLTPDGQVHTSTDPGITWKASELPAPGAQAMHASGAGNDLETLVPTGETLMVSTGGAPFETLASDPPQ